MAGATVSKLNEILKTFYLHDHLVVEVPKVWMCEHHATPQRPRYDYVCAVGDCDYPDECPHAEYVLLEDSPDCCLEADWGFLLDENDELYAVVVKKQGVTSLLEGPTAFLHLLEREADEQS